MMGGWMDEWVDQIDYGWMGRLDRLWMDEWVDQIDDG